MYCPKQSTEFWIIHQIIYWNYLAIPEFCLGLIMFVDLDIFLRADKIFKKNYSTQIPMSTQ